MSKTVEQWLLFKYLGLEFTPLSKPFKTREQAERASENTPAGALFISCVRLPSLRRQAPVAPTSGGQDIPGTSFNKLAEEEGFNLPWYEAETNDACFAFLFLLQ